MKNDGTNFFKYAVAVAVACTKDERPKGDVTPEEAAGYIRSILELIFCYSGIEFMVNPMTYPKCSKIPIIIRLFGVDEALLWYYPQMPASELAVELESLLQGMMSEILCMTA